MTMALPKRGLVLHPGAAYAGEVRVADIGIPPEAVEKEKINTGLLDRDSAWGVVKHRKPDAHKGDFGRLMVIAGSLGKAGAAVMAGESRAQDGGRGW